MQTIFEFVQEAHTGQLYGNEDYFLSHLMGVYSKVNKSVWGCGLDELQKCVAVDVALLHDILEDTDWKAGELVYKLYELGIPHKVAPHIVTAVLCLTKREGEDYNTYMTRVKTNPVASFVKYYDSEANMEACIKQGDYERAKKYLKNMCELVEYTK